MERYLHLNTFTGRLVVLKVSQPAGRHCVDLEAGEEAENEGKGAYVGHAMFVLTSDELDTSLEFRYDRHVTSNPC